MTDLTPTRTFYEAQSRDALGRYTASEIGRFDEIERYFADPEYRAAIVAERQAKTRALAARIAAECDRVFAERAPARRDRELRRLMDAGISHDEAMAIVNRDDPL